MPWSPFKRLKGEAHEEEECFRWRAVHHPVCQHGNEDSVGYCRLAPDFIADTCARVASIIAASVAGVTTWPLWMSL